jgi:transcriptional regulator with AAA-type ATPase domain
MLENNVQRGLRAGLEGKTQAEKTVMLIEFLVDLIGLEERKSEAVKMAEEYLESECTKSS